MRFINDRLAQIARISAAQTQPDPRDSILEVPGTQQPTVEFADPIRRGGSAAAGFGTAADPVSESIIFHDHVDLSGVSGIDSRNLAFFSPGLWHINLHKGFEFNGTTNQGKNQLLRFTTVAGDLGSVIFSADLLKYQFVTGSRREMFREFWIAPLTVWTLVTITGATVAADELHSFLSVVARRFF